jgi:hypothetical protein
VPMCYLVTRAGRGLLIATGRLSAPHEAGEGVERGLADREALRQARRDVHVAGWLLALETTLVSAFPDARTSLRGADDCVLSPPSRAVGAGRVALGPADLRLPGGRTPHDFMRSDGNGRRLEVERFETVRPDGAAECSVAGDAGAASIDVLVEFDDRLPAGRAAAKLERYDHLVAGWAPHLHRYGRRLGVAPLVVFVCRDVARARACARQADAVLTACRAYAGEYPADWEYPGRERIVFAAERDIHERRMRAYGVPSLPPHVRVEIAGGDPAARACEPQLRELLSADLARVGS